MSDFICGANLCQSLPIGQMMIQIIRVLALLSSPTFNVKSDDANTIKWTKKLMKVTECDFESGLT